MNNIHNIAHHASRKNPRYTHVTLKSHVTDSPKLIASFTTRGYKYQEFYKRDALLFIFMVRDFLVTRCHLITESAPALHARCDLFNRLSVVTRGRVSRICEASCKILETFFKNFLLEVRGTWRVGVGTPLCHFFFIDSIAYNTEPSTTDTIDPPPKTHRPS